MPPKIAYKTLTCHKTWVCHTLRHPRNSSYPVGCALKPSQDWSAHQNKRHTYMMMFTGWNQKESNMLSLLLGAKCNKMTHAHIQPKTSMQLPQIQLGTPPRKKKKEQVFQLVSQNHKKGEPSKKAPKSSCFPLGNS